MYRRNSFRKSYSSNSRSRNQRKAADQQKDIVNVVLKCPYEISCGQTMVDVAGNQQEDDFYNTGCAAINIFDVLKTSEFYINYVNLYDEIRIDCIRAKIMATNWMTSNNNGDTGVQFSEYDTPKSYIICTAWDRSGLGEDQFKQVTKTINYKTPLVNGINGDLIRNENGEIVYNENQQQVHEDYCIVGNNIATYSSAMTKHLGPGNAYQIVRQLYPSSTIEKEQFISTSLLRVQYFKGTAEDKFVYREWYNQNHTYGNGNDTVTLPVPKIIDNDPSLPTNILSYPAIKFKPTLLINVMTTNPPTVVNKFDIIPPRTQNGVEEGNIVEYIGMNKIKPVTFNIEFEIAVTFRGLRYSKMVNYF